MGAWRFLDYYTDESPPVNVTRKWYAAQEPQVMAAFEATITTLEGSEDWTEMQGFKYFETGPFAGLSELRFHVWERHPGTKRLAKRRFRIPGIWRSEEKLFILLGGCEKSGRIKIPQDAFEQAMKRKIDFEHGKGKIDDHR
jgi:hypothetical protein